MTTKASNAVDVDGSGPLCTPSITTDSGIFFTTWRASVVPHALSRMCRYSASDASTHCGATMIVSSSAWLTRLMDLYTSDVNWKVPASDTPTLLPMGPGMGEKY